MSTPKLKTYALIGYTRTINSLYNPRALPKKHLDRLSLTIFS